MKEITRVMVNIYNLKKICFMGYKTSRDNPYTYHHCFVKKCHGGEISIKNGAILTKFAHEYLHIIESRDIELYEYINNVLKQINEQMHEPLERQIKAIWYILEIFEEKYKDDTTSKGKVLIKNEYRRRNER